MNNQNRSLAILAIAGFALLFYNLRSTANASFPAEMIDVTVQWILPIFAFFVSLLMVSRIPYPHMINQLVGGQRSFAHVVAVVFALIPDGIVRDRAALQIPVATLLSTARPERAALLKVRSLQVVRHVYGHCPSAGYDNDRHERRAGQTVCRRIATNRYRFQNG